MYMDVQVYSSLNQFKTQKSKLFLLKAEEAFHISHDKEELLQNTLSFGSILNNQFFQGSGSQRCPPRGHLAISGDTAVVATGLLASAARRPGTLLSILRGLGQPHGTEDPASKVIRACQDGKLWSDTHYVSLIFFQKKATYTNDSALLY